MDYRQILLGFKNEVDEAMFIFYASSGVFDT
jgi:hypothetical protein